VIRTVALAILFSLTACKAKHGPDVALLLATLHDERSQKDVQFFEVRAHELGLDVVVLGADNDNAKQGHQVADVLERGAKVIVVQPIDSRAASSYVELAHEHDAKIVAYGRAIVSPDLDFYVSYDSYKVGVLQAQAALAATHGKGKFVLLSGQAGHAVATEITRGYEDTLAPYIARGDVEVVAKQNHSGWAPEQAQRTVEDALARTGNHVDAILANNSGMARGAVAAVSAAGVRGVFIAGADADAENVNFVCQGKQSIEVLKDIQPLAKTAADIAKQLLAGKPPKAPPTIALAGKQVPVAAVRVELVTPENVKPLLVDTGFLKADDLPACKGRLAVVE
jgi:D-xylose transport system substrate-binding protein